MEHVSTKPYSRALLLSTVFAAGLAFAQATPAQEAPSESPGPYAKYLMSVGGMGREQALNAARGIDRHRAAALSVARTIDQDERSARPKLAHWPDRDDNGAAH